MKMYSLTISYTSEDGDFQQAFAECYVRPVAGDMINLGNKKFRVERVTITALEDMGDWQTLWINPTLDLDCELMA